jgi:hypothetical protein
MTFDEIAKDLMEKQKVIEGLHNSLMKQKEMAEHKITEFKQPFQAEIDKLDTEIQEKLAHYKAECKKHFGICDGENMNVLETLVAFKKAMSL